MDDWTVGKFPHFTAKVEPKVLIPILHEFNQSYIRVYVGCLGVY